MAFFTKIPVDKAQIEAAIERLEQKSSAELRVYIERKLAKKHQHLSAMERALMVFDELEMQQTQARNGVLIYLAYKNHLCSVIGDQGIHQFVNADFWQNQCDQMIQHFKQQQYTQGIVAAIENIGEKLAVHFPIQPDDVNELANEVIIND